MSYLFAHSKISMDSNSHSLWGSIHCAVLITSESSGKFLIRYWETAFMNSVIVAMAPAFICGVIVAADTSWFSLKVADVPMNTLWAKRDSS